MQLLDCIETQIISNRLPLVAVTMAAVPYANTPVVLTLHWHGFVETRLADVDRRQRRSPTSRCPAPRCS